ncbi:MAG: T9SS type A sorting domain-containing protein [Bacteroidota bacterium]
MNPRFHRLLPILLLFASLGSTNLTSAQSLLRNIGVDSLLGTTDLGNSNPAFFTALNDSQFVFQAITSPLEIGTLHVSDGTRQGTRKVGSVTPDGPFIQFRDQVYFYGTDLSGDRGIVGFWTSDGTDVGTELVFEGLPTSDTLPLVPRDFYVLDSIILFSGVTATHGRELWRTNGTAAGTWRITDISPGPADGFRGGDPAVIDGHLYFTGTTPATGLEPYRTDGTVEGTVLIDDLNPGPADSGAAGYTESGGYIYFSGNDGEFGREVRRMRPGQNNIELIGENGGSTDSSVPVRFTDAGGRLFYVAFQEGADGLELVTYNHEGEPEVVGPTDIFPQTLKPFGDGQVVFKARDANGRELWISDGTNAGTHPITDLYPGPDDGVFPNIAPNSFHVFEDTLVYYAGADGIAANGEFVSELFVTDGTAAGTQLVSDQVPGTAGSSPGNFFTFGGQVFFAMTDPLVGREPFVINPRGNVVSLFAPAVPTLEIEAKVFPNPIRSSDLSFTLSIDTETSQQLQVQLYDQVGRKITAFSTFPSVLPTGTHQIAMNLPRSIRTGTYYLQLATPEGSRVIPLQVVGN